MKSKALIVIACCLLGSTLAWAPDDEGGGGGGRGRGRGAANEAPPTARDTVAPDISNVVAGGTKVQLVKDDFKDAQGAAVLPDGSLIFPERSLNRIMKLDKDGNITSYMENTSQANGFAFDSKGRLIAVQFQPAQVAVLAPTKSTLVDKVDGHGFGQPKDLAVDKKGGVYFTDRLGIFAEGVGPGVYYVKPDGQTIKIASDIPRPTGIALSPDEKTLYVVDSLGTFVKQFDVQADGTVRNERNFAELFDRRPAHSLADGATVDAAGRLYVSSYRGVVVVSPEGKVLGTIPIPRQPMNLAFGGPDRKTLYVMGAVLTARDAQALPEFGAIYKIPMLAEGIKGRAK
jgi:gluconolactonase